MECGGHVDAAGIVDRILAAEHDILGAGIGANLFQQSAQRNAAPLADHAPAFDADVTRHVRALRHGLQLLERPGPLVRDRARELEPPGGRVDDRNAFSAILGVEAEFLGDHALREGARELVGPKERGLNAVVHARDQAQKTIDRSCIGNVAAGQERQRRQAQAALEKDTALKIGNVGLAQAAITQLLLDGHDCCSSASGATAERGALPVIIGGRTLGTSAVSAMWTTMNRTMPVMPKKWM